jgi:hypothetical protein
VLAQEHCPAHPAPARGRPEPVAAQECPDRGRRNPPAQLRQFPLNPLISPPRILASQPENQRPRRLVEGRSARPPAGTIGPLPSDELAVPAEHGLRRYQEGAPGLPRQATTRRGEEQPVTPPKPRAADLSAEHLKLVAQDHDLQVFGVLVIPHERGEDSPEEQGHERPHHGGPPACERPSGRTALLLGTPTVDKCTLQALGHEARRH